jgi:hypothetical protein
MRVGAALLEHVRAAGKSSVAVVGIAKNVGKTVTMRALYEAAYAQGVRVGLVSAGRDGEAFDAVFENPKPRLWLYPGTWIATASAAMPERMRVAERSSLPTACGPLEYARVTQEAYYELVGPPTAAGLREAVNALAQRCALVLIDGAIDRLAVIATGDDAIIAACGAAAAQTQNDVVNEIRALVDRLRIPKFDPHEPALFIEGALLTDAASKYVAEKESRQIVVESPAAILLDGRIAARSLSRLRLRCRRTVDVVAVTVASIGPQSTLEPRRFLHEVASATGLPTYDVYAGAAAGRGIISRTRGSRTILHPERVAVAAALGREAIESNEFIVMRDELHGHFPDEVRVVREAPTYLLCEIS